MDVRQAQDVTKNQIEETADVVIVGSGAGGAVMAFELAQAGHKVLILEAGPYVKSNEFTEHTMLAMEQLYVDGGAQSNADGDLTVLQGRCVGGSTTVNACVAFRIPDWVLNDWTKAGVPGMTPAELMPLYETIEKRLYIHENYPHEVNYNGQLVRKGAEALGWSVKNTPRNVKDCALTGYCISGCRYDRKMSMLVTYLPWAMEKGAVMYADTEVTEIRTQGGRATGVNAVIRDPKTGEEKAKLKVNAKLVVLSAGAVASPLILQQNGLAQSSAQLGENFVCHPSISIPAMFPQKVEMWNGAQVGVHVDEFDEDSKGGFLFESAGTEPQGAALSIFGTGKEHSARMERFDHVANMIELIHDSTGGRISWKNGKKHIEYRVTKNDRERLRESLRRAAQIWFAAGAEEVYIPTVTPLVLKSADDIRLLDDVKLQQNDILMTSYHPQGTCRMGVDPSNSVVNPYGQTHEIPNLVVADASVFPTSVLVNTQLPTYVMAARVAEQVKADPARYSL